MNFTSKTRFGAYKITVSIKTKGELNSSAIHGLEHAIASASDTTVIPCIIKSIRQNDNCAPGQGVTTVSTTASIDLGGIKAKAKITFVFDEHILNSTAEMVKTAILESMMIELIDDLHRAIAISKSEETEQAFTDILRAEFGDESTFAQETSGDRMDFLRMGGHLAGYAHRLGLLG